MDQDAVSNILDEAAAQRPLPSPNVKEVEVFHFRRQNQHSYARHEDLEGHVQEFDCFTCAHDNIIVYMNPTRPPETRFRCPHCMELLCDPCSKIYQFNKTCMNALQVIYLISEMGEEKAFIMGVQPFNISDRERWMTAEHIQNRRIY